MSKRHKRRAGQWSTAQAGAVSSSAAAGEAVGAAPAPNDVLTAVPRRTWHSFFAAAGEQALVRVFQFLVLLPLLMLLAPLVLIPFYRASLKDAEFTVDRRERVVKGSGDSVQSYYLVWSREGEVFCVSDTWAFLSFDSSDRYGKLREGAHVEARVAGWRVPFLSWYRNVVEIKSVESK